VSDGPFGVEKNDLAAATEEDRRSRNQQSAREKIVFSLHFGLSQAVENPSTLPSIEEEIEVTPLEKRDKGGFPGGYWVFRLLAIAAPIPIHGPRLSG
jgi:hypothetical protein